MSNAAPADGGSKLRQPAMAVGSPPRGQPASFPSSEVPGAGTPIYVIGQRYRVPCVRAQYYNTTANWPVMGPQHEDADYIGFELQHYHIDWRFVSATMVRRVRMLLQAPLMTSEMINQDGLPKPVMRSRIMQRAMPDFVEIRHHPKIFGPLEAAYAGCKLKPGLVCPHRGIPLAGMHQVGDVVSCPGHGLRWNVKTGELVTDATAK